MPVTFLHTADWQIGKPFARVEDEQKRSLLRQERLQVITRLGAVAQEKKAQWIVVAGDVFDSPTPDKATVSAACAAIGALGLPVYVIPGNHDHGGPGGVWDQAFFQQERASLAPNLTVLLKPEPVMLEHAVLLPCPLLRQHEARDVTDWLRTADFASWGIKPRVVIAHGSVQSFGMAGDEEEDGSGANFLNLSRLPSTELDYVALGDWHGSKDVSVQTATGGLAAWYSGTPEPDRFPRGLGNDPGHALVVTVARGAAAQVEQVRTSRLAWHELEHQFTTDEDLERLDTTLAELFQGRAGQDLLRLTLKGSLGMAALTGLEQSLDTWRSRLLRLRLHFHVNTAPTEAEISELVNRTDAPLSARVAARLLEETQSADAGKAALARQALRLLHAALGDVS